MTRSIPLSMTAGLALFCSLAGGSCETFPVIHDDPITVRVLSGKDGKPVPHAHLLLVAGYDQEDLRLRLWQDETLTDAEGKVILSKPVGNLPFLQVWVGKAPLCQDSPRKTAFSIEQIHRDGLSTPNHCGIATVTDRAGIFTVFVKPGKKLLSPDRKDVLAYREANPAATPAPQLPPKPSGSQIVTAPLPIAASPAPRVEQMPMPPAIPKPSEAASLPLPSATPKEGEATPWSVEHETMAKSPLAFKPAIALQSQAHAHSHSAKRRTSATQACAAYPKGTGNPEPATPPSKAMPTLPKKGSKTPGFAAKPQPALQPKAKAAVATAVEPKTSGPPPTAPKIAVNLETAPPVVRPASLETTAKAKPAAGRDLEQPLARSPLRRRIKNPKDAAAAAAAATARTKAASPAPVPATATPDTPVAPKPVVKPSVAPVGTAAVASPPKNEVKKE